MPSWKEGQSFRRVTIVYNACPHIITELLKKFGEKQKLKILSSLIGIYGSVTFGATTNSVK